jgi:hypothetical protein
MINPNEIDNETFITALEIITAKVIKQGLNKPFKVEIDDTNEGGKVYVLRIMAGEKNDTKL